MDVLVGLRPDGLDRLKQAFRLYSAHYGGTHEIMRQRRLEYSDRRKARQRIAAMIPRKSIAEPTSMVGDTDQLEALLANAGHSLSATDWFGSGVFDKGTPMNTEDDVGSDDSLSDDDVEALASEDLLFEASQVSLRRIDRRVFVLVVRRALKRMSPRLSAVQCNEHAERIFQEVDSDCVGFVSWEAFTEFLIERIEEDASQSKGSSLKAFDRYVPKPRNSLLRDSRRVCRINNSGLLLFTPRHETHVASNHSLESLHTIANEAVINDAMYIDDSLLDTIPPQDAVTPALFTFTGDLQVHMYDFGPRAVAKELREVKSMRATATITTTSFRSSRLFAGDREGKVTLYDGATLCSAKATLIDCQMGTFRVSKPNSHRAVTGLIPLSASSMLSSSLEGNVVTTDVHTMETVRSFHAHDGGVACMAYSHLQGFVVTQGFAKTTTVWVGTAGGNSFQLFDGLNPHLANVVAVEVVDDLNQILTADSNGLIKIWDIRKNTCLFDCHAANGGDGATVNFGSMDPSAVITPRRAEGDFSVAPLQRMVYDSQNHRIVTTGYRNSSLLTFVPGNAVQSAHDDAVRATVVVRVRNGKDEVLDEVVSATGTSIKVWNTDVGGMLKSLPLDSLHGDVTALGTDGSTKILYGTAKGFVVECRASSGRVLKVFAPDRTFFDANIMALQTAKMLAGFEVCGLYHSPTHHVILSISADGKLRCYSDIGSERVPVRIVDVVNAVDRSLPQPLSELNVEVSSPTKLLSRGSMRFKSMSDVKHQPFSFRGRSNRSKGPSGVDNFVCAYSHHLHLLAVATAANAIRLIDEDTSTGVPLQEIQLDSEVNCMLFLGAYPLLLIGRSNGVLSFHLVRGAFQSFSLPKNAPPVCSVDVGAGPQQVSFDHKTGFLYVSDNHAKAHVYLISRLIIALGLTPLTPDRARGALLASAPNSRPNSDMKIETEKRRYSIAVGSHSRRPSILDSSSEDMMDKSFFQTAVDAPRLNEDSTTWITYYGSVESSVRRKPDQLGLEVSSLAVLGNCIVVGADLSGNVMLWAPRLRKAITQLSPSSRHSLVDAIVGRMPPSTDPADMEACHDAMLGWFKGEEEPAAAGVPKGKPGVQAPPVPEANKDNDRNSRPRSGLTAFASELNIPDAKVVQSPMAGGATPGKTSNVSPSFLSGTFTSVGDTVTILPTKPRCPATYAKSVFKGGPTAPVLSPRQAPKPIRQRFMVGVTEAPRGLVPALPHKTVTEQSMAAKEAREQMQRDNPLYRHFRVTEGARPSSARQPTVDDSDDEKESVDIEGFGMVVPKVVKERVERADRRIELGLPPKLKFQRRRFSWEV